MPNLMVFQLERPIFLREQFNQLYGVIPYYFAKLITEIPVLILTPLIYSSMIYFAVGLERSPDQFFMFYLIMLLVVFSANSFGYLISSMFNGHEIAVMFSPVILLPVMMFGGMAVNLSSEPGWIS